MPEANANVNEPANESSARAPRARPSVETISVRVSPKLANRVRNAIFWTAGETLVSFGERALEREVARAEKANGGPFPERTKKALPRGPRAN